LNDLDAAVSVGAALGAAASGTVAASRQPSAAATATAAQQKEGIDPRGGFTPAAYVTAAKKFGGFGAPSCAMVIDNTGCAGQQSGL